MCLKIRKYDLQKNCHEAMPCDQANLGATYLAELLSQVAVNGSNPVIAEIYYSLSFREL